MVGRIKGDFYVQLHIYKYFVKRTLIFLINIKNINKHFLIFNRSFPPSCLYGIELNHIQNF